MLAPVERTMSTRRLRSNDVPIYAPTAERMRTTFFWAAGLAAISTGLLPVRLNILVNIGALDLLRLYGRPLGPLYLLVAYSAVAPWLVVLVGLGFAGRSGQRWAFLAGMVLYGADMIALMAMFHCGHSGSTPSSYSNGSRDKKL
jgi:hypothetical protein